MTNDDLIQVEYQQGIIEERESDFVQQFDELNIS